MPFYEYECTACKFYVEALQKISEAPLRKCPSCKKQALKRLVSAPVFRLKGGGWYETDFKSDKEQKRNLAGREEGGEAKVDGTGKDSAEAAKPAEAKAGESKPAETKSEPAKSGATSRTVSRPHPVRSPARPSKPAKTVKASSKKAPPRKKTRRG